VLGGESGEEGRGVYGLELDIPLVLVGCWISMVTVANTLLIQVQKWLSMCTLSVWIKLSHEKAHVNSRIHRTLTAEM
jgi:hypothetical protein